MQNGRIYEPSKKGPISGTEEDLAVQTRAMREAEETCQKREESDDEAKESDENKSMTEEDNGNKAEDDWRTPIHDYLDKGILPADVKESRKIESKATMYSLRDGVLYKSSFLGTLLRFLSRTEGRRILHDIHSGEVGNHGGRRSLAVKAKMEGYYWLSMDEDAKNVAKQCERCQRFVKKIRAPATELNSIISPWPFTK
ncbi:uncharacterized protein LOC113291329 [Papaver somniferum]|uniref:uncharacterized protein LOC113291329 n=1 Tax=Papaver somniferum TaxID=3469 RepID=UPI000E705587|nr:uncharacterized protein LOC113291329 [Papaver somniferum]